MKIAIVGAGNVATHLAKALRNAEVNVCSIWSLNFENAEILASEVGAKAVSNLSEIAKENSDFILIAVKDDVIEEISNQLVGYKGIIAHTSGTVNLSALAGADNFGVFYPLQTFSKQKDVYFETVPLCLEANSEATLTELKKLGNLLGAVSYMVNSKQREALHVAAVFACNFPNYLYGIAQDILAQQQLSFDMIRPLITETANKVQNALPAAVQTGPAARNDEQTLLKHRDLLKDNPEWLNIYSLLSDSIRKNN